jgi:hypothetical protein
MKIRMWKKRSSVSKKNYSGVLVSLAFFLLGAVPNAQAALMGDTVIFDNFSLGIWGNPTVSGDEVSFTPLEYRATVSGGPGVEFVSGAVEFDILAQPGFQIMGLNFQESGDSFLLGESRTIVDGTLIAGGSVVQLAFPDTGNVFVGPGGFDFDNPAWQAEAIVDFSGSPVQSLHVVLENELVAQAIGVLDLADINKAFASLEVDTAVIPLPPAVLLFVSALGFLGAFGRRRLDGSRQSLS